MYTSPLRKTATSYSSGHSLTSAGQTCQEFELFAHGRRNTSEYSVQEYMESEAGAYRDMKKRDCDGPCFN